MSYCAIVTFVGEKAHDVHEFGNSWGGAAGVWTALYDKFLKTGPYDSWLFNTDKLWRLDQNPGLLSCERAVLISTFDYATVVRDNFPAFVEHLREFTSLHRPTGGVCHWLDWATAIEGFGPEVQAIGFYHTSVSENLWVSYDEDDNSIPYDLTTGDKHFEVYEHLASCVLK